MEWFWSVSKNEGAFQQAFIQWMMEDVNNNEPNQNIFLGGSRKEGGTLWFSVCNEKVTAERFLESSHEEADDRILFHVYHVVKLEKFASVAIASSNSCNISIQQPYVS